MKYLLLLSTLLFISFFSAAQSTGDEMHVAALQKKITGRFEFSRFWFLGKLYATRPDSIMADVSPGIDKCKRDLQLTFSKEFKGMYYTGQNIKGCKKQSEAFTWKIERTLINGQQKDMLTLVIDAFDTNEYEIKELTDHKLILIGDFNLGGESTVEGMMEMRRK